MTRMDLLKMAGELLTWAHQSEVEHIACDEKGKAVMCTKCTPPHILLWKEANHYWYCPRCGTTIDRETYFRMINAKPEFSECAICGGHFPICQIYCSRSKSDEKKETNPAPEDQTENAEAHAAPPAVLPDKQKEDLMDSQQI